MIQAFYNGLSGLFSFSKGLKTVSGNVSNMNTPGFRASDNFFRNVGHSEAGALGVEVSETRLRNSQGELRQSGNSTDMAINGRGFFIMETETGERSYTRAGQFRLNDQHRLIDTVSGLQLMALRDDNSVSVVDLSALRIKAPTPTTRIDLSGNLVTGSTSHVINDVRVFDSSGQTLPLTLTFSSQTQANSWNIDVTSETLGTVGSGNVQFSLDGTVSDGHNTVTLTLASNGNTQQIELNFGTPGSLAGTTQFSGAASSVVAAVKDGSALTGLSNITVNDKGVLQLTYANGSTQDGPTIALAHFADESALIQNSRGQFTAAAAPESGRAMTGAFGKIQAGYLELSNVDLAQEFGDLIIIQRGYQASSRVMTVASEMLEQLYNSSRGS